MYDKENLKFMFYNDLLHILDKIQIQIQIKRKSNLENKGHTTFPHINK